MVAVTELFAMWDSKVRAEFVPKRQRMEISKLRNIKLSSKEEQPCRARHEGRDADALCGHGS